MGSRIKDQPNDPHSSDSDTKHDVHQAARRRSSRAGTRSVTTLSTAQLERKRANDREAQRAIRQRTKDHIERLERRIADLTHPERSNEQLVCSIQRCKELEAEVNFLRGKLEQFGAIGDMAGAPHCPPAPLARPLLTSPTAAWNEAHSLRSSSASEPLSALAASHTLAGVQPLARGEQPLYHPHNTDPWQQQQQHQQHQHTSPLPPPQSVGGFERSPPARLRLDLPLTHEDLPQSTHPTWPSLSRDRGTAGAAPGYASITPPMGQQSEYAYIVGPAIGQQASTRSMPFHAAGATHHDQHVRNMADHVPLAPPPPVSQYHPGSALGRFVPQQQASNDARSYEPRTHHDAPHLYYSNYPRD